MFPTAKRRDKLRRLLRREKVDGMLITSFTNVTYLTGFSGDDSYLLVTLKGEVLLSDPRYDTQLKEECPDVTAHIRKPGETMLKAIVAQMKKAKIGRLAVEAGSMTVDLHKAIAEKLGSVEIVPVAGLVEKLRMIKDKTEIARTRDALTMAKRAFEVIRSSLRPTKTEKEVAAELEYQMRLFGARGFAFPSIVAAGPRAALPHAVPTDAPVGDQDFILFDWGACEDLYRSDLTRVLHLGKISPKYRKIYGIVLKAQVAATKAIRPGIKCCDVDAVARKIIAKAGYGKYFGHGLGHGLGLDVHEAPRLAVGDETILEPGMIVTVEPGIYLPDWGGIRIEDDVLVTRSGYEVLSADVSKEIEDNVVYC
ncbi:MAG: Xaa-Pro peptidase family protein [Planctomycetia bacterium]|jgi:Xaa-Pro aminopeptidase